MTRLLSVEIRFFSSGVLILRGRHKVHDVPVILSHFDLLLVFELQIASLQFVIVWIAWKKFLFILNYLFRIRTTLSQN
jgi:hypothetical protein